MNFTQHLFGTIAGHNATYNSGVDFIPLNSSGKTIDIKGRDAVWLGLKNRLMQKYAYEYCFPVASVVDRLAEYDITGVIEILRAKAKGRGKEDDFLNSPWADRMYKLLEQPNPLQNWEQFRGQQVIYKKIFGFCPVLPLVPAGFEFDPSYATAMINLPPWCFDVEGTKQFMYTSKTEDIIKKWVFTICGNRFEIEPTKLFILEDSFFQDEQTDFILPQSRLVGLDMAVSNICAAMEADNVLLKKKGPLGFISSEGSKDGVGAVMPMADKEKDKLQEALQKYGLSLQQFQYVISGLPAKWNSMSYNVKELGTKETVQAGEKAVCHRYSYPYVLYEEQDATFANAASAAKAVYNNNVIPNNKKDLNKYNKFFKALENSGKIVGNFDDTPALQEDAKLKAEAADKWNSALKIEYDNNLITLNQWRQARGYDTVVGDDKYKRDITTGPAEEPVIEDENAAS